MSTRSLSPQPSKEHPHLTEAQVTGLHTRSFFEAIKTVLWSTRHGITNMLYSEYFVTLKGSITKYSREKNPFIRNVRTLEKLESLYKRFVRNNETTHGMEDDFPNYIKFAKGMRGNSGVLHMIFAQRDEIEKLAKEQHEYYIDQAKQKLLATLSNSHDWELLESLPTSNDSWKNIRETTNLLENNDLWYPAHSDWGEIWELSLTPTMREKIQNESAHIPITIKWPSEPLKRSGVVVDGRIEVMDANGDIAVIYPQMDEGLSSK
jgi:hypothetical protein